MQQHDIDWPAFIKYAGDDELALVADDACWQSEFEQVGFDAGDFLVDSAGRRFALPIDAGSVSQPGTIDPVELGVLLRGHFAALGQCCIAKLPALPATEVMQLLQQAEDQ